MPDNPPPHGRLRRRSEFLAAAKGLRFSASAFAIQAIRRSESGDARFGFTATKKTGNAVERARMRRRLKEAIRTTQGLPVRHGYDYVMVARRDALSTPFAELSNQIALALAGIAAKLDRRSREAKKSEPDDLPMKAADPS